MTVDERSYRRLAIEEDSANERRAIAPVGQVAKGAGSVIVEIPRLRAFVEDHCDEFGVKLPLSKFGGQFPPGVIAPGEESKGGGFDVGSCGVPI